ncbi:HNH endonuclease [Vreelandella aquamarina]|uniref:HNH nuclease domain-containing protein n=1 Tax=Vreelandella aquamarina TaxID=77097 RepID=A0A857GLR1_9GAMM|nr:HNH endonuclease [Halomonas meridiana]QHD50145.1 hypothetical protein CTT34_10805 [Halomonas meridiana]
MDKVVVHSYTRGSFRGGSGKYVHYDVVSGPNPFGPRGGLVGKFVDGKVRKHFWERNKAEEFAQNIALKEGLIYLSAYDPNVETMSDPVKPQSEFDIDSVVDDRENKLKLAHVRKGQKAFRSDVLNAFGGKCVVTGCDIPQALQACHIYSYIGEATNHPSNGLLLRSDLHGLFDSYLITVSAKGRLLLSSTLKGSYYKKYNNLKVRFPSKKEHEVSESALDFHRDTYKRIETLRRANK